MLLTVAEALTRISGSGQEIAEKLNCCDSHISNIKRGRRGVSPELAHRIGELIDADVLLKDSVFYFSTRSGRSKKLTRSASQQSKTQTREKKQPQL